LDSVALYTAENAGDGANRGPSGLIWAVGSKPPNDEAMKNMRLTILHTRTVYTLQSEMQLL
jgi:hypothetical protein